MSTEDLEKYETEMELTLYREYRDVVGHFAYVVETERRFYLCNEVDVKARPRPAMSLRGLVERRLGVGHVPPEPLRHDVKVLTFKDVNVEELSQRRSTPPRRDLALVSAWS